MQMKGANAAQLRIMLQTLPFLRRLPCYGRH